jgi:rod shape-determining protein MreD
MLILCFVLATLALILQGTAIPQMAILAYAPFVAYATLRSELMRALFLSALAGAIMDTVSEDPMGVHALNYVVTTALLFKVKKHFSHDEPLHLSLFSGLFSSLSTSIQLFLLFLFDRRVPFGGRWILGELIAMPVVDALYAFVWFAAIIALGEKMRRMWNLFWLKRKNPSPISH